MTDPDRDLPEEIMWAGRFITAKTRGKWEYVSRARGIHAAVILAIDEARVPLGRRCIELPAGLVGDEQAGEDASLAAARELEEETGYRPERLERLGDFSASPGMVSEGFTLFRAHGLTKTGAGGGVAEEDILVHRVPLDRIADHVADWRAQGYAMDVKLLLLLGAGMVA